MILAALLLAQVPAPSAPQTAVDAERAFAADAQKDGQWTAFRRWAADDAIMFDPKPVNASEFLKPLKDPPKAIMWSPAKSFVSCDGQLAVNTGPWTRPNGTVGYFTSVWKRQLDGAWKWTLDHGDALQTARAAVTEPVVRRADCRRSVGSIAAIPMQLAERGMGLSPDGTLIWQYSVKRGVRRFTVSLWNGQDHEPVLDDRVAVPPQ